MNGIGHSIQTPCKEDGLDKILRQHLCIVENVLRKHTFYDRQYVYVDANSGSGSNPQEGVPGSPIVFLGAVSKRIPAIPYYAYFIDQESGNTDSLRRVVFGNSHEILTGDNADLVPAALRRHPHAKTLGLVYTDPNGVPDFDMLAMASAIQPRMDILIRYNSTAAKRNRVDLFEELPKVGKGAWIVREIEQGDKWQWTFLFGSNYLNYPEWRKHGFIRTDTNDGMDILRRISFTNRELAELKQSSLFDTPEKQAIFRSKGICEVCHMGRATEVNHLCYPAMSDDDVIAVCHSCHCKYHGVKE